MSDLRTRESRTRRGGVLVLVVLTLAALLGVAALAVDIGLAQIARQRAQAVADAAALAGAAQPDAALQGASAVVAANGGPAFQGLAVSTASDGTVTAAGYVDAPLAFAPAVGYAPAGRGGAADTLSVPATATARMPPACGLPLGMPVAPFGLIGDDPSSTDPVVQTVTALLSGAKKLSPGAYQPASAQLILKLNVWDTSGNLALRGNFDPLLTSGSGVPYSNTIAQNSDQPLAAGLTLLTPLAPNNTYLTRQYLAARLSRTNTQFTHDAATYDAWYNGRREQTDGHLLLLPVVSQAVRDKQGGVTILAFAAFWVDQPYPPGAQGSAVALGRFLGVSLPAASDGTCSAAGTRTGPRLFP